MTTINPFAKHTSQMFASRGCDIDSALTYAHDIMQSLSTESDKTAVMTAIMVIVNTASNAFAQATGPGPEKIAIMELINQITREHINNAFNDLDEQVADKVSGWMSNNLDNQLDEWANNSMAFEDACDNRVERWIENNLDVSSQVSEALDDLDLSEKIEGAINDLDLVVRVR
mgnify:CR=1 FL=1